MKDLEGFQPDLYIDRPEMNTILDHLSLGASFVVVEGVPGTGKTVALLSAAQKLAGNAGGNRTV
jgi:KaiC/GvpD/RAD55 family RecA-like ATPase